MRATVFIGGGRITGAMLAGLKLAGYERPVIVHDRHPQNLRTIRRRYGVKTEQDLHRAVDQAILLIIAVRPDSVKELLHEIGGVNRSLTVVSLAAGVPLGKLRKMLGNRVSWARAMPSPVCRSRKGLTALTFDRKVSAGARRKVKNLFSNVGQVIEIPESKFDAFTVTYSCSHGYHALATLSRTARKLGLSERTALIAAAHALADGVIAWREGDISLENLLQEAATPGGIAAAVMKSMDAAGYQRAVQSGIAAGLKRTSKNRRLI